MASTSIREVTSQATLDEKKKLRKEFNYFDMIFYTIAALVGIDTLGAFSSLGSQSLTWLLISAVTFLLPYGLLTAELGSTFTQEGGMYEWCKLAGGRFFASFGAMLYWISTPLWVGGTLAVTAILAIKTFWFGSSSFKFGGSSVSDAIVEMVIALLFIWGPTWCAIMSLRFGKWLSVFCSYVKLTLLAVFIVLTFIFVAGGHATGQHFGVADLIPTNQWGFVVSAILPVLIFNWVGFELQNGAGEEMHDPQRDVPRSLIRAGLVATALGWLVALGIVIALASSGGTWVIGADRTYAIAALDRTAPSLLGRFSGRYGTPIAVNTMTGIVATITMAIAILISEFVSGGSIGALFGLVLGFTISTTTLSYLFIFPTFLILRYKYPHVRRTYRVPGGMVGAWIVTLLPLAYAAIASYFILIPGDSTISSSTLSRATYELTEFAALGLILLLTIVFYVWGHLQASNRDVVVELHAGEADVEVQASSGE